MKITIKTNLDLTPSLETYVESKLAPLAKFLKHFEEAGDAEIWLEISRTSKHHKKGDVFKAVASLQLPKKMLRAETYEEDIRTAIDEARNMLRAEIDKYKTQFVTLDKKKLAK